MRNFSKPCRIARNPTRRRDLGPSTRMRVLSSPLVSISIPILDHELYPLASYNLSGATVVPERVEDVQVVPEIASHAQIAPAGDWTTVPFVTGRCAIAFSERRYWYQATVWR